MRLNPRLRLGRPVVIHPALISGPTVQRHVHAVQHNVVRAARFASAHSYAVFRTASHVLNRYMVQNSQLRFRRARNRRKRDCFAPPPPGIGKIPRLECNVFEPDVVDASLVPQLDAKPARAGFDLAPLEGYIMHI